MRRRVGCWGVATLLALTAGCGLIFRGIEKGVTAVADSSLFWNGRHGALTETERTWAAAAWRYFENNVQPETGLVNAVDNYPNASMWNVGDYLAAAQAAHALGLVEDREFNSRISKVLHFLNTMPLAGQRLPNKRYSTLNGTMVDYGNQPRETGWSAIEVGRLLIWLKILAARRPDLAEYADKAVLRWNFCDVIDSCGTLYGGQIGGERIDVYQEGRLGYEQYAALGFQAWGFDTTVAGGIEPVERAKIFGVEIFYDARDPRETGVPAPVVTLPYVLQGMEFDFAQPADGPPVENDLSLGELAERVYEVQERRYEVERILTARTDHPTTQPPYLVYDAIFSEGYPWNTTSPTGELLDRAADVSTRAAFGMWALWNTSYTDELIQAVSLLYDPERGWYEGRLETTGGVDETISCTTNAVVLEAVWYKTIGRLYETPSQPGYAAALLHDEFKRPAACLPPERGPCR